MADAEKWGEKKMKGEMEHECCKTTGSTHKQETGQAEGAFGTSTGKWVLLALGAMFVIAAFQTVQLAGALAEANALSAGNGQGVQTAYQQAGQSQPASSPPPAQNIVQNLPTQVGGC